MDKEYAQYLLNKTKSDYNLIAEDFSRTRQRMWGEYDFFKDYVKDGDIVLDAGCGNGRFLELLTGKNIDYTGTDNSEKLIELARKRYPENKFLVADSLNLPFPDSKFDKGFSIAVLHHIPSVGLRKKFLEELKRVLKPEGILILTVWNIWRKKALPLAIKYTFLKILGMSKLDFGDVFLPWGNKTEKYYHFFTKKELERLIKKSGFKIIKKGIIRNKERKRSNIYIIAEKAPVA